MEKYANLQLPYRFPKSLSSFTFYGLTLLSTCPSISFPLHFSTIFDSYEQQESPPV